MVASAGIRSDETVLEIGPGTGNLTALLLKRARAVFAVELDGRLAAAAAARAAAAGYSNKFFCVQGCALRVPLPSYDRLVANIPYQISSPVLARLWSAWPPPKSATLLVQEEFAERLVARPGSSSYSRLSVNCALLSSSARIVLRVGREQFVPPPRVDSAVVEIVPRPDGAPGGLNFPRWDTFLRAAFGGKNKHLRAVLTNRHVLGMFLANAKLAATSTEEPPGTTTAGTDAAAVLADDTLTSCEIEAQTALVTTAVVDREDVNDDALAVSTGNATAAFVISSADWMTTQHGRFTRASLLRVRASVDAIIARLDASDWRANAMTVDQFRAVFSALEHAGCIFTPARQRVFPALLSPQEGATPPPPNALR